MATQRMVGWLACTIVSGLIWISSAAAQTADVIYTWDHTFGEAAGPHVELWEFDFGAVNQSVMLDNATDGALVVTETGIDDGMDNGIGGDWAIRESFNRVKERFGNRDGGGLDLFGLSALEIEIGHNGPSPVAVQVFSHVGPSSQYTVLNNGADIVVGPGAATTYNVSLDGLSAPQITAMRTLGLNVRGHGADGNLTWSIHEIRSAGPGANRRLIANHSDGDMDFDGVLSNFDDAAVISKADVGTKSTSGLTVNTALGVLQWQESAGGPGLAIEYGGCDNCYTAEDFAARPHDLSNYDFARARVSVQSTVTDEPIIVQFYQQNAGYVYHPAPDLMIPADGQFHELVFDLRQIPDRDWVDTHGLNFGAHEGAALFRVDYVEYFVPEPASWSLLLLASLFAMGLRGRRS